MVYFRAYTFLLPNILLVTLLQDAEFIFNILAANFKQPTNVEDFLFIEMDGDDIVTPQKAKTMSSIYQNIKNKSKKLLHTGLTPRSTSSSASKIIVGTSPPAKRFQRIRNPFESTWAERLNLPMIGSPSLFNRPTTPQLSSTQFEWTIDEVSVLQPAHVEPHETQFHDSPNSDFESKAQLAISSYFKEQQIVPSPVDCPLRSQRIMLSEINSNTPISKPGRRIRDCEVQTELTLPPILPPELEAALRPYLRPHLSGVGHELNPNKDQRPSLDPANNSMRRKLFDMRNIVLLESGEQSKQTAGFIESSPRMPRQQTTIVGKLSDSLDKSSFGSLSPITNLDGLSPSSHVGSATKRKTRQPNFEEGELLSPIQPLQQLSRASVIIAKSSYRCEGRNISEHETMSGLINKSHNDLTKENFTPERSSSPMQILEFSTNTDASFNNRVSRLRVNSSQKISSLTSLRSIDNLELFATMKDDTQEETIEEDDLHMSTQSFNCSSNSNTPRGKRRSANRKNLSQSFNTTWMDDDNDNENNKEVEREQKRTENSLHLMKACLNTQEATTTTANFYRTDSGFNETTSTFALSQEQQSNPASEIC